jgi:diguanylate cyclase (GGDEF)-like protein/PAS domain S-box-containing protein
MKLSIEKKVTSGFSAALILLGICGGLSYWSASQLDGMILEVAQANKLVQELQLLLSELKDTETGQRGYLLTGEQAYLAPYDAGIQGTKQELQNLKLLIGNSPSQQKRLNALEPLITSKLAELNTTIRLRQRKGFASAVKVMRTNKGKKDMDAIRVVIQDMENEARQMLKQQEAIALNKTQAIANIISYSCLLGFGVVLFAIITINRDLKRRLMAEKALRDSETRFQAFMNNSPALAYMKDRAGRYIYINTTLEDRFKVKFSDLQGKTDLSFLPEKAAEQMQKNDQMVLENDKKTEVIETDGQLNYWLSFKFPIEDSAGQKFIGGISVEITDRIHLEQSLFQQKELAQVTLNSIGDAVITTDACGLIQMLNPVAEGLTGWSHQEAQGLPVADVFKIVNEITREPVENPIVEVLQTGCIVGLANHTVLIARDGREIAIADSAAPIRSSDGQIFGAVMVFHDVSDMRSLTQELSWQASHDPLTNLVNRREFEQRLGQAVSSAKSYPQQHALCYLDLDQFKIVNDTCGHNAGDELLRQITVLLKKEIRKTDTLARLGGDEFGLLLDLCPLEQAEQIANTIREQVQAFRFTWNNKVFAIGVSIGLVVIDAKTESVAEALSIADTACYAAKNNGRNRVQVYQADDINLAQHQSEMQWVGRIVQALEENRFCLYYQSITRLTQPPLDGEHYEVLLRLKDETGQLVLPMAFIPAAERYHLMHLIDRWTIATLFAQQGQHYREIWQLCQQKRICQCSYLYAINLSGASLNDEQFIKFLHEQFALHQIPPHLICFEITETVAITNLAKAAQFIRELRNLGCRFALDDFGSGMSSFAYLKNLPVDYIKIDGGFIKNILDDPVSLVIVEAINQIGQAMGIQTIAEFVENSEILDKIKELGVNYVQGYGIAPPRPFIK